MSLNSPKIKGHYSRWQIPFCIKNKSTSLPTHDDPTDLANKFAHFFKDKIYKIRQSLPSIDYTPVMRASCNVPKLSDFKPVTTE